MVCIFENSEKVHRYIEISTFGLINYLTLTYRAVPFMDTYKLCSSTEEKMKQLGMETDFTICRWTISILYVMSFGGYSSVLVIFFVTDLKLEAFAWEMIIRGIPAVLMTSPMYNFMSIGSLLYTRFKELNKLIEDQLCVNDRRVNVELTKLAQMHSDLCKATNSLIYSHEYTLLTYYLYTFVQLGEFILNLMGYFRLALSYNDILWNSVFIPSNLFALVLMTLLKYESTLTGPALCELTEAFVDKNMNEQVKTRSLQ